MLNRLGREVKGALILIVLAILAWKLGGFETETLTGSPKVIDGDSIELDGDRIRLVGIDAPEGPQKCIADQAEWACGREATLVLRMLLETGAPTCEQEGRDQFDRRLATCFVGDLNINREMVRLGWAVPYSAYYSEAREAEREGRGIWKGTFDNPEDWRRENR